MVGAVVAAIVLTVLLPDELRLGPSWLLPLVEAVLLVALVLGDPGAIDRRSRVLRALSIALVAVLVLNSLWSTAQLIDVLINGGEATNSARELLSDGAIVWASNNIAFAPLLGARRRWRGGTGSGSHRPPRLRLSAATEPTSRAAWLAAPVYRLSVSRLHECDGLQPHGRDAARAPGEDRDGDTGGCLARHSRARHRTGRERVHLAVAGRSDMP
jgi:hypothetical protein